LSEVWIVIVTRAALTQIESSHHIGGHILTSV